MAAADVHGRWFRRSVGFLVGMSLALAAQVAGALAYYQPGPRGTLGISRPVISQQFVLKPGEQITRATIWIDGVSAEARWDESGLVSFTPAAPLQPGRHTAKLSVEVSPAEAGWTYDPVVSEFTFTVGAGAVEAPPSSGPEELRALERVNLYRKAAGLAPMTYSDALGAASAGHARYLVANPAQRDRNAHGQQPGTPLYFGAHSADRARYYGYAGGTFEIINFTDRAEEAVEGWMDTLYHRIPLLHPGARTMGYGLAGRGSDTVNVLLAGPGDDAPGMALWPYPGQTNVPTGWDGAEVPDPFALYPGAEKPVGYTITITFGGNPRSLTLETATLKGPGGPVPAMTFAPGMDPNLSDTVALIPRKPLAPGATYRVRMAGKVDQGEGPQPYEQTWSFTTAPEHRPQLQRRIVSTAGSGTFRRAEVEGNGFGPGMKLFFGGLPVTDFTVHSGQRLSFLPPAGYAGGPSDLLVVTPSGWEVRWRNFYGGQGASGSGLTETPLSIHGLPSEVPALRHSSGAMLVPADLLATLGWTAVQVPEIGRTFWTREGQSINYTLGRTAAGDGSQQAMLALPVRLHAGRTYVDAAFLSAKARLDLQATAEGVHLGLRDIGRHWAKPQILRLLDAGIVSGSGDGLFRPDDRLTRAAFVKMLIAARKVPLQPGAAGGLSDTAAHWVAKQGYIGAAVAAGIVLPAEHPGGRFEPEQPITREEMAVMVARALGLEGEAASRQIEPAGQGGVTLEGKRFTDAAAWTRPGHIAVAVEQGIISGYQEAGGAFTYRPLRQATRAEAAVMIVRTLDRQK